MTNKIKYQRFIFLLIAAVLLIGLPACSHKRVVSEPMAPPADTQMPLPVYQDTAPPQPYQSYDSGMVENQLGWNDPATMQFTNQPVYFDYNSYDIRQDSVPVLQQKADFMRMHPGVHVEIQGHCDERGTEAYNLALGDRRSFSVKKYMVDLGIDRDRMFTISYGEERPAVPGHNEQAWAKNRRVEFVIGQ